MFEMMMMISSMSPATVKMVLLRRSVEGRVIGAYCMLLCPCCPERRAGVSGSARVTVSVFSPPTQVGKRRGGAKLALKTGVVAKKQKHDSEVSLNQPPSKIQHQATDTSQIFQCKHISDWSFPLT